MKRRGGQENANLGDELSLYNNHTHTAEVTLLRQSTEKKRKTFSRQLRKDKQGRFWEKPQWKNIRKNQRSALSGGNGCHCSSTPRNRRSIYKKYTSSSAVDLGRSFLHVLFEKVKRKEREYKMIFKKKKKEGAKTQKTLSRFMVVTW